MKNPILPLKENASHGTIAFPCATYMANYSTRSSEMPFICKHHWHEETEIIFFERGEYELEIGMERTHIQKPCLCFVRSAELHSFYSQKDYVESAVVFSPSMLAFSHNDSSQAEYILPFIQNELFFPRFLYSDHPYFSTVLHWYQTIFHLLPAVDIEHDIRPLPVSVNASRQLMIKASLLGIIAALAQANLLTTDAIIPDRRVELIKDSLSYMKEHYAEKIYVSELASKANMNEQYYCRFFKKVIGKSPIQYLNELRIRHSIQLLRETDDSVMDISLECGFNNLGNYMKFFKQQTGTTPLQYRKKNGDASHS